MIDLRWTRDPKSGCYFARGASTIAVLDRGRPGWQVTVSRDAPGLEFLDSDGTPTLAEAKARAAELVEKWDRNARLFRL